MTIKIFSTDTQCPNCGTDIYSSVHQRCFEGSGSNFEHDCPACGVLLAVEVESVPSFKLRAAEQIVVADVASSRELSPADIAVGVSLATGLIRSQRG